jgi:hypothetical protein
VLRCNCLPLCYQTNSAFKTDPAVKVLLISLKAGGVALNLTVASRIFLMGKILLVCVGSVVIVCIWAG